jgi:hypothetical protein
MRNARWSDREIDALLMGKAPTDGDLARLAPLVEAVRGEANSLADSPTVETMARVLAEAARKGSGKPVFRRERRAARVPQPWGRRLVVVSGVAVLATVGAGGVAVAADGAAPGDLLYSVDRAFEAVGIGNGGSQERLHEAVRLADEGDVDGALRHAAHAVREQGDAGAAGTLETTAGEVTELAPENETEVRDAVSDMLRWITSTDADSSDFDDGVADRARAIGDTASRGRANQGDVTPGKAGGEAQEEPAVADNSSQGESSRTSPDEPNGDTGSSRDKGGSSNGSNRGAKD